MSDQKTFWLSGALTVAVSILVVSSLWMRPIPYSEGDSSMVQIKEQANTLDGDTIFFSGHKEPVEVIGAEGSRYIASDDDDDEYDTDKHKEKHGKSHKKHRKKNNHREGVVQHEYDDCREKS